MNHELTRKLAEAVEAMPAFPNSVRKIIELTSNIACPPKDLVQVIDTDPVLALRLLRVVNSSYYGLASRLTSVSHAVVFMGINTIKNLALSVAAIGMMPARNAAGFDVQQYLQHSLSTAGIAKQLAARTADADPNDCFMAGLLHDFGKVVFAQCMPAEFALALEMSKEYDLSLHLTLRKVAGVDHASVGAALVEKWRFPEPLVETIRYQYGPDLPDTPGIAVVFAANQISKKLGLGFAGNDCIETLTPAMTARLGGDLDHLIGQLTNLGRFSQEAKILVPFADGEPGAAAASPV